MSRPDVSDYNDDDVRLEHRPLIRYSLYAGLAVFMYRWWGYKRGNYVYKSHYILESRIFIQATIVAGFIGSFMYYDVKGRDKRRNEQRRLIEEASRPKLKALPEPVTIPE